MKLRNQKVLVTGGAGFIGSHFVSYLLKNNNKVIVVDNLENESQYNMPSDVIFHNVDLSHYEKLSDALVEDIDIIIHLAYNKMVNSNNPNVQFKQNSLITQNILQAASDLGINRIAYASSSTVYGEAPIPTPEDFAPLKPISIYGAAKLSDEALLSTYTHSHNFTIWNFRFANVVGKRLRNAVIPDFICKLKENKDTLTILGDGYQEKSYIHVDDCITAMTHAIENKESQGMHTFNIGTRTTTSVNQIAEIVSEILGVDPVFEYTGGDRGWTGDVPRMRLSIEKLRTIGWEPELESTEAVHQAAVEIKNEMNEKTD